MKSMTLDLYKRRKLERKNKNKMHSKRRETEVLAELKALLEEYLKDNDSMMIEVDPRFLSEFQNIVDSIVNIYNYQQIESTLFVFSHKEFS